MYIRELLAKFLCKIGIHLMYQVRTQSSILSIPLHTTGECVYCGSKVEFKSKYVRYWNTNMISKILNRDAKHFD